DGLRLRPDVDISLTCCAAVWPVEVAAPVALFVNEAVSNALKHAFRTRGGRVEVTVAAASDDGLYRVGVADDGEGFSDETREGLGSHLMRGFARQLKGRLSRSARPFGPGAELVIFFRP
ncbi:MAG: ATP-binding protein, partial [Brevundimonas sp.]